MIPMVLAAASANVCLAVCNPANPAPVDCSFTDPRYVISEPTLVPLSVVLPVDDVVAVVSSLPASLEADSVISADGMTQLIDLIPLAATYTNSLCSPYGETVSVTDSEGLLSETLVVDIIPPS